MKKNISILLFIAIGFGIAYSGDPYKPLDIDFLKEKNKKNSAKITKKDTLEITKKKKDKDAFETIIEDFEKIEGFFTFYKNVDKNEFYLELKPEQLDSIYLMNITRETGDGAFRHGVSMQGEFPFYFKKIGNKIQLTEKNIKFRSNVNSPTAKALENQIPDSYIRTVKIKGKPHPETRAILIDAHKLFIFDYPGISGPMMTFDKTNSFLTDIKSFELNSEIEIDLNYKTKGVYLYTLADSRNITYTYHYSLVAFPENDYSPRLADDRVGYFQTIYQDYTDILTDSPYVRYVNRWDLKKKNPNLSLSEPIKPIVFWLENTIPLEFRESIKEGVLAWNQAYEAIGFKNAVVVKQMPDDADWNPADVRYSTIRWLIQPGDGIAVGPSRANPFTGEIYDADIRISADFVRFFYTEFGEFLEPMIAKSYDEYIELIDQENYDNNHDCNYAKNMMHEMAFAWYSSFELLNIPQADKKKILDEYIHDGIVDLIMHEVGHTLGLRHNFKASSIYSLEQISDPDFVSVHGPVGSVMDYNGINLMDGGHNFYQTTPGPYDYWAIEYAYSEIPPNSDISENKFLDNIASKSTNPLYVYCTDEDSYGSRSIDPYCTSGRDLSSDPIDYFDKQLVLVQDFWDKLLDTFEKDGERYPKIRSIFYEGLYEYYKAGRNVSKFIGGIEHSRHHVGETEETPLNVIPANDQRKALKFLNKNIFTSDSFNFSPELLNKLAPERYSTMESWGTRQLAIPIHNMVSQIHSTVLYRLFDPRILQRVQDNEIRFGNTENKFTLNELFETTSTMIWNELELKENVDSFRRNLQKNHLKILIYIMLDQENKFPNDAVAISRKNLNKISTKLYFSINNDLLDENTNTHYVECLHKIKSAHQAHATLN